ncbi:MAG: hypothetical protein JW860_08765 [Sedimentisphaerales bacterium]|nr:hypothetical protein [Sedimentisphaerales bacterium]
MIFCTGCLTGNISQWTTDALIRTVGQQDLADRQRLKAMAEIQRRRLDSVQKENLGKIYADIMASPLHSPVIRGQVLLWITSGYPDEAPIWLGKALVNTSEPQLHRQIVQVLVSLNDAVSIEYMILALDPEANPGFDQMDYLVAAIEHITGKPLYEVFLQILAGQGKLKVKMAALAGMLAIENQERVIDDISNLSAEDMAIEQLQFWSKRFGYLPTNMMRFFQCYQQSRALSDEQFQKLQYLSRMLFQRESYQFDVRDSYILLHLEDEQFMRSREDIIILINGYLSGREHTRRPPSYKGAADDYQEDFTGQSQQLSYTDLIKTELLLRTLTQPDTMQHIWNLLEQDTSDTGTEVGGLCFLDNQRVIFKPFSPGRRQGQNQYVASEDMIHAAVMSLAQWHCHTDKWRNKELAGPGTDDMKYARWHNCPVVILTKVNDRIFNVDYLSPEGIVIDLGDY